MLNANLYLINQLHPTKNINVDISKIKEKSNKKLWWQCEKGHEWEAIIYNRTKGTNCPYCTNNKVCSDNSIKGCFPSLAEEWHPTKNIKTADQVLPGSNTKYWWKCLKNSEHEWQTSPNCRCIKNAGCPHCNGNTIFGGNTIANKYPNLVKEWHPTKNKPLQPSQICPSSDQYIWWLCSQNHEYEAKCGNRTKNNSGCPYCSGKKSSLENNLQIKYPEVAKEWHPDKNPKTPDEYTMASGEKVWWKCSKNPNHEWEATIVNRTSKKTGCPVCNSKGVNYTNNLSITHPEIAKEWHPTKNGLLKPTDITKGLCSNKIWWLCSKDNTHEWYGKAGCPYCTMNSIEKAVEEYCIKKGIKFEPRKKFKGIGALFYDFYLPHEAVLIECDDMSRLSQEKCNIIKKNVFAMKKKIPLLRISYLEETFIETILDAFLLRIKSEKVKIVFSNFRLYKYA